MPDRFEHLRRKLEEAVLGTPGETESAFRRKVARGEGIPAALAAFVDKVRRHAYRVTDEDVAELKAVGYGDDALFELMASVAVGAARERFEAGMRALRGERAAKDEGRAA
jgi:alkylhydroperoxidase family enzyme